MLADALQRWRGGGESCMGIKLKKLRDQVIVITGASSGIGRTTAEMAAARGARVVLSSRNEAGLRSVVDGIRARGGRAVHVVADVADPDAMEQLARRAVAEFGQIDTWVNNAGIGLYGRTTEVPLADKRRMFDINFWGVVHGCRAALPYLQQRGGALINIGSVTSDRAIPLLGIYAASKHAVKGYTDALRMELEEEKLPISVSLVKPGSVNTPFTEHARNYMEAEPEYAPPVYAPEAVARAILECAERPTRDVTVGGGGKMLTVMGALAPRLTDAVMERTLFEGQKKDAPPYDHLGSLDAPQGAERRHGSTEHMVMKRSAYTRAAMSDVGRALPVIAVGAMVAAGLRARKRAG
jgi:short-subunit dehydrogenase